MDDSHPPAASRPSLDASKVLFRGPVFKVRRDVVRLSAGRSIQRDVVEHPGAVVIVPRTSDGNLLLVRQYRHAAGEVLLEFPAGTLEPGEDPAATAARELREEVGFRAGRMTPLGAFFSAPGFCTELLHCFLAEDLTPDPLAGDEDEDIEVVTLTLRQVLDLAAAAVIRDAKSLASLLLLLNDTLPRA